MIEFPVHWAVKYVKYGMGELEEAQKKLSEYSEQEFSELSLIAIDTERNKVIFYVPSVEYDKHRAKIEQLVNPDMVEIVTVGKIML